MCAGETAPRTAYPNRWAAEAGLSMGTLAVAWTLNSYAASTTCTITWWNAISRRQGDPPCAAFVDVLRYCGGEILTALQVPLGAGGNRG
jgi:hypothetical protein